MDKIRLLPEAVVNQIAAGEVVERPASIVKELAENSIDAQASKITIEIEEAGIKLIRISDNGCGMSKNDALLAIERHSTSKIHNFNDLSTLRSLGFRGEALSSIAGVSRFRLVTKEKEASAGFELIVEGSKIKSAKECAHSTGTIVEVSNLFFNVPARKKFLKSPGVEQTHVIRVLEDLALSHPDTGFSVKLNGKILFNAPSTDKFETRIVDILGNKFFETLVSGSYESNRIKIKTYVSRLGNTYTNKNAQYFFVNGRAITNRALSQAFYGAFKDTLPIGRHPAAIILIEIDPKLVDVNVHPSKKLVKFSDEHEIYEALSQTVRKCLTTQPSPSLTASEIKTATQKHSMFTTEDSQQIILSHSTESATLPAITKKESVKTTVSMVSEPATEYKPDQLDPQGALFEEFHILGYLHDTYVLIETSRGLVIMDQHAANERVLYEKFLDQNLNSKVIPVQQLLIPLTVELLPREISILTGYMDEMARLGFEISGFGKNTVIFKSIPAIFGGISQLKDFLNNFLTLLIDDFSNKNLLTLKPIEKIIRASCRAAVKARDKVSPKETEEIIKGLKNCRQPLCCPHGRPTMVNITINELEKKFGRI